MASSSRNAFTFVFTMVLAAIFFIVTGLIGYRPPARLSLDASTWRSGTWSDEVVVSQIAIGLALLAAAAIVARRINRRLSAGRE
jgi:quinol-cytochrome oxidoreductase complex cytochrome b subunit